MNADDNFYRKAQILKDRGYAMRVCIETNENYWIRGNVVVTLDSTRCGDEGYFIALLNQKESQVSFEII